MNQEQRNELGKLIVAVSGYYARTVDKWVLSMMIDDLADLPFDDVVKAYADYRRNPKNRVFPLPAAIRELVQPQVTIEAKARELAARIQGSVVKFGHANPKEACEHIGDSGWSVVQRYGGWSHLCQQLGTTIQPTTFYAQVRDQLEDAIRFGPSPKHGLQLEGGNSDKIKSLVQGMSLKEVE